MFDMLSTYADQAEDAATVDLDLEDIAADAPTSSLRMTSGPTLEHVGKDQAVALGQGMAANATRVALMARS